MSRRPWEFAKRNTMLHIDHTNFAKVRIDDCALDDWLCNLFLGRSINCAAWRRMRNDTESRAYNIQKMSFLRAGFRSSLRPRVLSRLSSPAAAPSRIWRPLILNQRANYSEAAALSQDAIQTRVLDVLKSFEKVEGGKVRPLSSFIVDPSIHLCPYPLFA